MCDYMWSGQLLNIKGCSHLCCHPCWFLRSAYMGIWLQGMMWRTTRGGLKRQMKMSYGAWFEGRWHNGGKRLKRRLGSIGWKEVSLTGLKGGDCRCWHLYRHYREEECFCIWSSWYRWDSSSSHSWQTDSTGQVWGSASWHIQKVTLNDSVCVCVCMLALCAAALENRHTVSVWVLFSSTSFFLIAAPYSIIFSSPLKLSQRGRQVLHRLNSFCHYAIGKLEECVCTDD